MKPPYFKITAVCHGVKCSEFCKEFTKIRKTDRQASTVGNYQVTSMVCPVCRCWGEVVRIKEVMV
jgi:hypothetical protein